ncbi:UBP-type zinc finger domain-containing protein [Nocardia acidivorans]|uniref:UBP-type zinc finger domain-containing protein n=1 Tax=Nocardia acidivorans TaxID=404580 RepID=UPI0035A2229C
MMSEKAQIEGIDPTVAPSGPGCVECEANQGWWLHLRRCAQCGHVGCCDSSPSQHASKHAASSGHPFAQSYEPGESWFYNYQTEDMYGDGPELAAPHHHPVGQTVPGPRERVPADWQSHLN